MARAVLLTGGNEGDVKATLASARTMVGERIGVVTASSSLHASAPWGDFDTPQQDFLNQALIVDTALSPIELLDATQQIERELGRQRTSVQGASFAGVPAAENGRALRTQIAARVSGMTARLRKTKQRPSRTIDRCTNEDVVRTCVYSSRPVDIDILFYGDEVINTGRLTIPHPLIVEREFALAPLVEIAPDLRHPVTGLTVNEMLLKLRGGRTQP